MIKSSDDKTEHATRLHQTLMALSDAGFCVNLNKIKLFQNAVTFLGLLVNRDGVKIDPSRIEAIMGLKAPSNKKQLRALIGFFSYFRKFIVRFSERMEPIQNLLVKLPDHTRIIWTEVHNKALEEMKNVLANSVTLVLPDFARMFTLVTDASNVGVGATLMQDGKPVAYFSSRLNTTQQRWTTTEKSCLLLLHRY